MEREPRRLQRHRPDAVGHASGTGPAGEVVRYFEIIREKWPDLDIPFEKIMKVAAAYNDIGEYERSYLVYRATIESSFVNENAVAGFLEAQGEFLRSVEVMNRLLAEYPPEPYVAATTYALAQRVYSRRAGRRRSQTPREEDQPRGADPAGTGHARSFPHDVSRGSGGRSSGVLAGQRALLELKAYKEVIEAPKNMPSATRAASSWIATGTSRPMGTSLRASRKGALELARKVAEHERTEKQTGREVESPNKWQAIYIMGQVFHSLGKAADAIAEYTKVSERFQDAKEAIAVLHAQGDFASRSDHGSTQRTSRGRTEVPQYSFGRNRRLPDRPDEVQPAQRNLQGITQINLSGIRPFFEETHKLGDGKDYRDRTEKLKLPLKEEGAYLVVCRGDDLHASGLVLISPLKVEVQEDAPAGRVRVTVKNVVKDDYVSDAAR